MTRQLKVGDYFRFIVPNGLGGSQFGTWGDIGQVVKYDEGNKYFRFKFATINASNGVQLSMRQHYMNDEIELNANFIDVEPLVKDYRVDQEPLEDEDCL
jgi:hypothetical protein